MTRGIGTNGNETQIKWATEFAHLFERRADGEVILRIVIIFSFGQLRNRAIPSVSDKRLVLTSHLYIPSHIYLNMRMNVLSHNWVRSCIGSDTLVWYIRSRGVGELKLTLQSRPWCLLTPLPSHTKGSYSYQKEYEQRHAEKAQR